MTCANPFRPARVKCPVCNAKKLSEIRTEIQDLGRGKVKFIELACEKCHFVTKKMELLSYKD